MSEWWTYSLSDFLLFSSKTYYRLFELYNLAIWPAHILALALGLAIFVLLHRQDAWAGRVIALILSACWAWVAWAYLLERYDTINFAARHYAAGFAIQAMLLLVTGLLRGRLVPQPGADAASRIGVALFLFALAGWPFIALVSGRLWTQAEVFGIAPDPTAVATLGVVLAAARPRWHLLLVPFLWCVISGVTLWTMRQSTDAALLTVVAVLALALALWQTWRLRRRRSAAL